MNTMAKRTVSVIIAALVLVTIAAFVMTEDTYAAVKLSKKSVIVGKGKTVKLKVKGTKKKVKWWSTKKSIATVTKKGVVKGKKIGTCYIKAKVAGKTLKCKVTVKKPNIANAMNLRKYILAKGKKASDGGYYISKTWYEDDGDSKYTGLVKAYKKKKTMFFKSTSSHDGGDYYQKLEMTVDLINHKPADVLAYFSERESDFCESYYGIVGYNFNNDSNTGVTATKYIVDDFNDSTPPEEYTDEATLTLDTTVGGVALGTYQGFLRLDEMFKKLKLKYRMTNLGFANYK